MTTPTEKPLLKVIEDQTETPVGITSSPSNTIEISIDIKEESKLGRILGQMAYFVIEEENQKVLVIGQFISIETQNRWHQDPAFKGVIRLHGSLPHLSGKADNRIAVVSVQAAYLLDDSGESIGHILGTSPSTGVQVKKMNNEVMGALMKKYENEITYIGKVYGTDVDMPFWFKHFDKGDRGAGDAHHIGVFGKSGSGKSVTAAYMLLGYAKNNKHMNILILDPQKQFTLGQDFPPGFNLDEEIKKQGMSVQKYSILEDLYLPGTDYELFSSMLAKNGFIKRVFNIPIDKEEDAAVAISDYLISVYQESKGANGNLNKLDETSSKNLMELLIKRFARREKQEAEEAGNKGAMLSDFNKYVETIYVSTSRKDQLVSRLEQVLNDPTFLEEAFSKYWHSVVRFFISTKADGTSKLSVNEVISKVTDENSKGNFIILDISGEKAKLGSDNIKAMFVRIIENEIKAAGERFYADNKKVNCLIVMDEAARFIAHDSSDPQIVELTNEIIDSVRTTRKYGIGYMFITQTIESLDKDILEQTRIFAFGYGLTLGSEIKVISNLVNNENALSLYRSFIDPSSSHRFPCMFFGSISPLSFTGAPLFVEVYTDPTKFR